MSKASKAFRTAYSEMSPEERRVVFDQIIDVSAEIESDALPLAAPEWGVEEPVADEYDEDDEYELNDLPAWATGEATSEGDGSHE